MRKSLIQITLMALLISACSPVLLTPSVEDVQTAIAATLKNDSIPTQTTRPTQTPEIAATATVTPEPTLTVTPSGPYTATVSATHLNLRTGPSTFFSVLQTYTEGETLTVISRSEDSQWVFVAAEDGKSGWMSVDFLAIIGNPTLLAIANLENVTVLRGKVESLDGDPIDGVNIAIINREGSTDIRTDVHSDEEGKWVSFIPVEKYSFLDIQIVGILCDSTLMNDDCKNESYYEVLGRAFYDMSNPETVIFTYAKATRHITGLVVDNSGEPAVDILVVAERDDGAESYVFTNDEGEFTLASDAGVWDVYTVNFDDGRSESARIRIEITDSDPEAIELSSPE